MNESLDLENDQFLTLLTDALRNGPGSPEWHQAVTRLGSQGEKAAEYKLLIAARQHLESGKSYRSIRAGPEFTRQVMERIEQPDQPKRRWLSANVIAVVSILVAAGIIAVVTYWLSRGAGAVKPAIEELANTYFTTPVITSTFPGAPGPEWRSIGQLPLEAGKKADYPGWVLAASPSSRDVGGGIVTVTPLPSEQAFAVEMAVWVWGNSANTAAQLFVSDDPQFSDDRGTSPHELVWHLQGGTTKVVLPNGRLGGNSGKASLPATKPLLAHIAMKGQVAIVESGGQKLWAGTHELDAAKPRYVGVRFIRRDGKTADVVAVQSVRVLTP